jgi:long-chain acyl-CoA synthetase
MDILNLRGRSFMMDRPWYKSYDSQVPRSIYYPPLALKDFFNYHAALNPAKPYLILNDTVIPYGLANLMARKLANALLRLGVKKGDRVAVMSPNVPQYVICLQACFKIGAVVVPVNPMAAPRELEHEIIDSGAATLIVMARFSQVPIARLNSGETPLERVIVFQLKSMPVEVEPNERVCDFDTIIASAPDQEPATAVSYSDTALLQYTGGTTGIPKGCMLSNHTLVSAAYQDVNWLNPVCGPGEMSTLAAIPLYHIYGFNCNVNVNFVNGGSIVCVPQPTPDNILDAINRHRPNLFAAVPAMILGLLQHPDLLRSGARGVKAVISGAAPLPVQALQGFVAATGTQVVEGFGMSETTGVLTCNPTGGNQRPGTVGLAWPDNDVRIVDLDSGTTPMPVGEPGELIVRGPTIMSGYWNNPDESATVLRDGWLYTGDIACLDEDGYVRIVDRKKDLILVSGFNVYPRDVDDVLHGHPKVLRAAAVGIPDATRGETVKAFILPKPGEALTEQEVIEYCRIRLTRYKVPTAVEITGELPLTSIGKIDRKALRQREAERALANAKVPAGSGTP